MLHQFLKEMRKTKPLKPGEHVAATRDQLIMGCQRFVYKMALRFVANGRGGEDELMDYVQQGNIGLCIAADHWDQESCCFLTFAKYHVVDQMQRYQRHNTLPFRMPTEAYKSRVNAHKLHDEGFTLAQIQQRLGISMDNVKIALGLTTELEYDDGCCAEATANIADDPVSEKNQLKKQFDQWSPRVSAVKRNVVYMLMSGEAPRDVRITFGITKQRVTQIRQEFIAAIR